MIIPPRYYDDLPATAHDAFLRWAPMLYDGRVNFNMPDSDIHAMAHCERVLLHALTICAMEMGEDDAEALEIEAQAAVFHDTRREDEYLDTGHGARAALYYEDYCRQTDGTVKFHRETVFLMRYHDLDDRLGNEAIIKAFGGDPSGRVRRLYAIFKDADALDRWRLGRHGLDPRFLRTDAARSLVERARKLVIDTTDPQVLAHYDRLVDDIVKKRGHL